ncbi:MAG: BlaI/MecI/CopY family transcriptional regulator [Geodermatophilaceae bacterium]
MRGFGDLETLVMDRLWTAGGSGTVREVFEQLRLDREIAYTTVLSTMDNLYRKGHLSREREGKAHRYQTILSHAEHAAHLMRHALSGEPDSEAVLTHFVGEMSKDELVRLEEILSRPSRASRR